MRVFQAAAFVGLLGTVPVAARTFEEHKRIDGMQVWQNSRRGRDVMWGRCNGWFRKLKSCILQETTCAAHLSPGPADADVEVRLGNLPVIQGHPTFVQWWSARKSDEPYDPLTKPEGAQVYDNMFHAYPRYFDPDFNGGNVQVDANGEAVIRFRAPATHRVHTHTRVPHVHLRICSAGNTYSIILGRKDKVQLTPNGPVAKSECNSEESKLHVLNFRPLNDFYTKMQQSVVQPALGVVNRLVERVEHLDLDALEFSPVFQCLSSGLYYDHFEGDCVDSCPAGSAVRLGQCVKQAAKPNTFSVTWDLQTCGCDERCWADKRNMTLHRLRLEIADHMDIPLQEVHELDMTYMPSYGSGMASVARMHIRITSGRHTADTGSTMLRALFHDFERSSEVLAMLVLAVREVSYSSQNLGFLHKRLPSKSSDPYEDFYQDLDVVKASAAADEHVRIVSDSSGTAPSLGTDKIPAPDAAPSVAELIGLGSLLCICFFTALYTFMLCKRKQSRAPTLRSLGQPLADVEDPPLFPGGAKVQTYVSPDPQSMAAEHRAVAAYLATVYARAV